MRYRVRYQEQTLDVEVEAGGAPGRYVLRLGNRKLDVDVASLGAGVLSLLLDGDSFLGHVVGRADGTYEVAIAGKVARLEVQDELASMAQHMKRAHDGGAFVLRAPMPGLVARICVQPGDAVEIGTPLVIMEAMKMQNELASEVTGVVREVRVLQEQAVESGATLVVVEST